LDVISAGVPQQMDVDNSVVTVAFAKRLWLCLLCCYVLQAQHELVILEGADHCFTSGAALYELAAAVLPFVSKHASSMVAGTQE
jgi:hypothetical protein